MKKIQITLLFACYTFVIYSQTFTLFTKPECNNCKYTKHNLTRSGILFSEFSLEDKQNAIMMLQRLKDLNYTAKIYLPVIIENDSVLLYPQENHNDSTLYFVVKNITANKEQNLLKTEDIATEDISNAGCDFNLSHRYIVCANFREMDDAENFKKILLNDGYPYAAVIFYKNLYRVYAMQVFESENELQLLQEVKRKYRGTYLLDTEIKN